MRAPEARYFAALRPVAQQQLVGVVLEMRENPQLRAEIVGHAVAIGPESYNLHLSHRRAQAVQAFLVTQEIPVTQLRLDWRGETQPIAPNTTPEGRAQNRRVELTLRPLLVQ